MRIQLLLFIRKFHRHLFHLSLLAIVIVFTLTLSSGTKNSEFLSKLLSSTFKLDKTRQIRKSLSHVVPTVERVDNISLNSHELYRLSSIIQL